MPACRVQFRRFLVLFACMTTAFSGCGVVYADDKNPPQQARIQAVRELAEGLLTAPSGEMLGTVLSQVDSVLASQSGEFVVMEELHSALAVAFAKRSDLKGIGELANWFESHPGGSGAGVWGREAFPEYLGMIQERAWNLLHAVPQEEADSTRLLFCCYGIMSRKQRLAFVSEAESDKLGFKAWILSSWFKRYCASVPDNVMNDAIVMDGAFTSAALRALPRVMRGDQLTEICEQLSGMLDPDGILSRSGQSRWRCTGELKAFLETVTRDKGAPERARTAAAAGLAGLATGLQRWDTPEERGRIAALLKAETEGTISYSSNGTDVVEVPTRPGHRLLVERTLERLKSERSTYLWDIVGDYWDDLRVLDPWWGVCRWGLAEKNYCDQ